MSARQATSDYAKRAGPAVRAVGKALRNGGLVKGLCAECGMADVQAHHHNGYDREHHLDIVWLCRRHHLGRHRRSQRPPWARSGHIRDYMAETRAGVDPWRTYGYAATSSPRHLFRTLERVWGLLRTDEERAHALALIQRLAGAKA